jgi:hypothetical protein
MNLRHCDTGFTFAARQSGLDVAVPAGRRLAP